MTKGVDSLNDLMASNESGFQILECFIIFYYLLVLRQMLHPRMVLLLRPKVS